MVIKETIEHPDMVLNSNNSFKDTLEIMVRRKTVEFRANIDGTGNTFTVTKDNLKKVLG